MSGDDVQCGGAQCSALGGIDRKMSEKEEKQGEKEEKEEELKEKEDEEKEDEEEIEEDIKHLEVQILTTTALTSSPALHCTALFPSPLSSSQSLFTLHIMYLYCYITSTSIFNTTHKNAKANSNT